MSELISGPARATRRLSADLRRQFERIVGADHLIVQETELALYSYDAALDRAVPCAVVLPENAGQISAVVKLCVKEKIPYVARGAGTNLCGGTIPLNGAVVIAPTRMKKILSIDPVSRTAVVEPGVPNLFLKNALAPYGLYYAPDPASQKACTIGGNVGTNAGGPHCLKYGVTSHHVYGLEVVMPDGKIAEFSIRRPGPDFTGLFVGSEGTLGIATKITLNLLPIPESVETMLAAFPSLETAIQSVTDIISAGIIPATLEAMDRVNVQAVEAFVHAGYPTDAEAVLLIEVDGGPEIKAQVERIRMICQRNTSTEFRLARNDAEREKLWEGRRGSYPSMARLAPNVLVEDGAVPRTRLPEALKKIRQIAADKNLSLSLIFHAGDGNLHPQILFDERDEELTRKVKQAGYEMLKACVDLGGTISGEHGVGIDKRDAMKWLFTPETLALFRRIKTAFDPDNLCNPDKLIPLAENVPPVPVAQTNADTAQNIFEPSDETELAALLKSLGAQHRKTVIVSRASSSVPQAYAQISTAKLNRVIEHDAENFTIEVQSGMPVGELQTFLRAKNQKVLLTDASSVGALAGLNPSQSPMIREQILGMKAALSDGTVVKFGAKVMKNVAGYDAAKLMLGSQGALGVIVSVILKTYTLNYVENAKPAPQTPDPITDPHRGLFARIKKAFDPEDIFPDITRQP